jgi:hypothetical protein
VAPVGSPLPQTAGGGFLVRPERAADSGGTAPAWTWSAASTPAQNRSVPPTRAAAEASCELPAGPRLLGVMRAGQLVFETANGLCVVDQVAARRALVCAKLERAPLPAPVKPLLFPALGEVAPPVARLVEAQSATLARFGIDLRCSGERAVSLLGVPEAVSPTHPGALLEALIGWLQTHGGGPSTGDDAPGALGWPAGLARLLARHAAEGRASSTPPNDALELLRAATTAGAAHGASGVIAELDAALLRPRPERQA